jgi:glyoxylase I family protein
MSTTPARFHHVGLQVEDIDRSLAFYRDLLGLRVTDEGEGGGPDTDELTGVQGLRFRFAELDLGAGQLLELIEPLGSAALAPRDAARPSSRAHVGVLVDDIDETYRRLQAAGTSTRSAPVELQEGGAWLGVRALYAADPDGFTVELLQVG